MQVQNGRLYSLIRACFGTFQTHSPTCPVFPVSLFLDFPAVRDQSFDLDIAGLAGIMRLFSASRLVIAISCPCRLLAWKDEMNGEKHR